MRGGEKLSCSSCNISFSRRERERGRERERERERETERDLDELLLPLLASAYRRTAARAVGTCELVAN